MYKPILILMMLSCILEPVFGNPMPQAVEHTDTTTTQPFFNANKTAFVTTISLAVVTAAAAIGAISAANNANTMALASYTTLALVGAAVSGAAIAAWLSFGDKQATTDAGTYLQKTGEYSAYAIVGVVQFGTQMLVQAVVAGIMQGTSRVVSRSIGGPDQTIKIIR